MRSTSTFTSPASLLGFAAAFASVAQAHMSPFTRSMYGVGGTRTGMSWYYAAGDPVSPIGPGVATQDAWWFRGPAYRALAPPAGEVTALPAGGSITLEIACHIAWTSFGWSTTVPGSINDACPGGTSGPYHSGDPNAYTLDPTLLSGCALAIANVDDISLTTMDNLVIFSVQPNCVQTKQTSFDIPAMMPACTGAKCICGWFWLANTGNANFYMTAFDCNVTNVSPLATAIAAPSDPIYCPANSTSCTPTAGAKRPLYAYNSPTNCAWTGPGELFNSNRPGYHSSWSFSNGAQNDIFVAPVVAAAIAATPLLVGDTREQQLSSRISAMAASRLSVIADRRSSAAQYAKTKTLVAVKARRTLAFSPSPVATAPAAAQCTAGPSCPGAMLEQFQDSSMLDKVFERQEWSAKAADGQ